MVHVHQYELGLYTPIRFALAAAYALPLVSESLLDAHPLEDESLIVQAPYDGLVEATVRVAEAPGDRGSRLFQALCVDRNFRSEVEKAL